MKSFSSKKILSSVFSILVSIFFFGPIMVQAQDINTADLQSALNAGATAGGSYDFKAQSGLNATGDVAGYDTGATATTFEAIISSVIYIVISFIGVIFFVLLIYGGFIWMTAQGSDEKVGKAKKIVTNSVIGLIITLSAYAISFFLISYFWK